MMLHLSPINQRRWRRFKAHRRGFWSLWVFLALFITSLGAELLANDKPLLLVSEGHWYFPAFKTYTEKELGGQLPFEPDYRSTYFRQLIEKQHGWMQFAPIEFGATTVNFDLRTPAPAAPSRENLLGTDDQARDVAARVIYGIRLSLLFAFALATISSLIGIAAGVLQGYYGGWVDLFGQRALEIWSGLPVLYLLIILSGFVQPGFWWLLGIMAALSWLHLVDVVRAEVMRGRSLEYVKAARALGLSNLEVMFRHVLPNALTATFAFLPFIVTGAIGTLSALDFLGFGMPAGTASLGELVSQGKNNLQAPWLGLTAFFALALVLSLLVFIGEACRDAFDPRA